MANWIRVSIPLFSDSSLAAMTILSIISTEFEISFRRSMLARQHIATFEPFPRKYFSFIGRTFSQTLPARSSNLFRAVFVPALSAFNHNSPAQWILTNQQAVHLYCIT